MDSVRKTRIRVAESSGKYSSVEDVFDLDKELDMERSLDDNECMWLSSDCASTSSFFAEHRLSGTFHLYANDWLISWLSTLADSYLHLDSEKSIPDSEKTFQEGLKCKGGVSLLLHSPANDAIDSSEASSESVRSSSDKSLALFGTKLYSCSEVSDMEKTNLSVSSMNLDGKDFNWISDTEPESGFSSPSSRSSCNSEVKPSHSDTSMPPQVKDEKPDYDLCSKAEDLEDFNANEPLFWPFELERNWSSEEAWKSFSMSPRKDITKFGSNNPGSTLLDKMLSKDRSRRTTASKILELKQRNNNSKGVKKLNSRPSRLKNSDKSSMKVVPLQIEDDIIKPTCMDRILFQDDFPMNEELPIEIVLGLGEFDGHEGVDSDINVDVFFMEEYL